MTMLLSALLAALFAQAQPDRTVSSQVVDDAGKPIAEARVVLYAPPLTSGRENTAEIRTTTDAEGRFQLRTSRIGRTVLNGVNFLVYHPGLAIASAPIFRPPGRYVLRKPEPRPVKVEGPDGKPVAGARIAPQVLYVSGSTADIPASLADPLAITTGPDGRATLRYLTARDQLVAARVATDSIGTQDLLLVDRPGQSSTEPVIAIRLKKTSRLTGRIMDEADGPVADQLVEVWSRGGGNRLQPNVVDLTGAPLRTAADGSFRTPDNLMVGSTYRVVVRGPGKEPILSDWMTIGEQPRVMLPMRLRPLRTIGGRVVDRQGKPVANVEIFQTGDGPEPTTTKSDTDGRFSLGGFRYGQVVLFARGDGFRFHGQLIRDGQGEVIIELTRTGEPPTREMRMLPELGPLDESRAMARRLIEPLWKVVVEKGDDDARYRTLEALVNADPAGTLEKLESAKLSRKAPEFRLRAMIAAAMAPSDPEDAAAVAEAIADPGPRASALLDVADALPAAQRTGKLALLDRAALHARSVPDRDQRLRWIGEAAERLYEMGEIGKAKALFAEGLQIAKGMPDKTDFQRGYFAAQLALVDLPAALAMVGEIPPQGRILTNLVFRLIDQDPTEAERIWKRTARMGRRAGTEETLTWKMATIDPVRARRVLESGPWIDQHPDLFVFLALGAKTRDQAASRRALDDGLRHLDRLMRDRPDPFQLIAGTLLPVAERIDPAVVPEFFWRDVASRQPIGNPRTITAYSLSRLIGYLAWYDRDVAAALFEPTRERIEHAEDRELATWRGEFLAWSLFDPRAAVDRLERVPISHDEAGNANAARIAVASALGLSYERRWRKVWVDSEIILGGTRRGF